MAGGFFGGIADLATKKVFGPNARFFPKSWEEHTPPFAARRGDLNPVAGADSYEGAFDEQGVKDQFASFPKPTAAQDAQDEDVMGMLGDESLRKPSPEAPFTSRPGNLSPNQPSDYSKEGITSMLDLKRLGADLSAGKVKNAPGLADQVVGSPKPKPKGSGISNLGPTKDLTGEGLMTRDLPAARNIEGLSGLSELPAARKIEGMSGDSAGGGGVEVQDSEAGEKNPRDWGTLAAKLSVGLADIGNAFGNPRAQVGGGIYEMSKQKLQAQQMDQLKRRQTMWDDAYTTSQQLPQEVLTDPRFAGLAQAKAALDKDMMDGKIDNEKNVSLFLTEQARVKRDLEELGLDVKAKQQLDMEGRLSQGRAEQEAAQTQRIQEILANPTAYSPQEVELARLQMAKREQIFEEDGQQLFMTPTQKAQWDMQRKDREDNLQFRRDSLEMQDATRRFMAEQSAQARRDSLSDRDSARATAALGSMVESGMRRYGKPDEDGNLLNPGEALDASLVENEEAIKQAARAAGVKFAAPGEGGGGPAGALNDSYYEVNGQLFDASNPQETAAALRLLYQLART